MLFCMQRIPWNIFIFRKESWEKRVEETLEYPQYIITSLLLRKANRQFWYHHDSSTFSFRHFLFEFYTWYDFPPILDLTKLFNLQHWIIEISTSSPWNDSVNNSIIKSDQGWSSPRSKLWYLRVWLALLHWKILLEKKTVKPELGESQPRLPK